MAQRLHEQRTEWMNSIHLATSQPDVGATNAASAHPVMRTAVAKIPKWLLSSQTHDRKGCGFGDVKYRVSNREEFCVQLFPRGALVKACPRHKFFPVNRATPRGHSGRPHAAQFRVNAASQGGRNHLEEAYPRGSKSAVQMLLLRPQFLMYNKHVSQTLDLRRGVRSCERVVSFSSSSAFSAASNRCRHPPPILCEE